LGFENIRQEDKDRILQKIAEAHAGSSAVGDGKPIVEQIKVFLFFFNFKTKSYHLKVEVAKSSTGKCQICKKGIESRDLRIQTKAHFFHVGCFHTEKNAKGRIAKDFAGFEKLDDDQKTTILSLFPEQGSTRYIFAFT
jgi:hypothetical protein